MNRKGEIFVCGQGREKQYSVFVFFNRNLALFFLFLSSSFFFSFYEDSLSVCFLFFFLFFLFGAVNSLETPPFKDPAETSLFKLAFLH